MMNNMTKKHKYEVYLVGRGSGCYAKEQKSKKVLLGETWAVSKAKAVANIHYRMHQNGEELPEDYGDDFEGCITWTMEAERV